MLYVAISILYKLISIVNRRLFYGNWTLEKAPSSKGTINAHTTINNNFLDTLNIPKTAPRDLTQPMLILERNFTIDTPKDNLTDYRRSLEDLIKQTPNDTISCYTDGSLTESGCGAGHIITTNNNNTIINETYFRLPDYCTVFQAELSAIEDACNYLLSQNNMNIIIWTDSLSSIQALTSNTSRSTTVNNCYNSLQNLATHNNVTVRWIAAHSGLWGNEKADELAKLGTTSTNLIQCPIPQSYIKTQIDNKVNDIDSELWQLKGQRHTNMTLGNNHQKIKKQLNTTLIHNRIHYRTAVHLITDHCTLNKHLHTIQKVNSSICPKMRLREETVGHFLGQCPSTSMIRANFFHNYYLSINDIFDNFPITTIINYATRTNRFKEPEHLDQSGVT